MLPWSDKLETGHPEIDSQHRQLIGYVNQLESLSRTTNPSKQELQAMLNLVDFMEAYAREHFDQEEHLMDRCHCPAAAENKAEHKLFWENYQQFKRRFEIEGCRPDILKELHETCARWVETHILKVDAQLKFCRAPHRPEAGSD